MRMLKSGLLGASVGIAVDYVIAIAASWALRLGYFMAVPVSMPERVGGEMNAVLMQLLVFALLGAGVAVAGTVLREKQAGKRAKGLLLTAVLAFAPAALLTARLML